MVEAKITQPGHDPWRALDEKVNWKISTRPRDYIRTAL